MKPYFSVRMLVLPALVLCLIVTSCKKENDPIVKENLTNTTGTEHRTVVLQADGRIMASPNVEMSLGDYSGSDYSLYPTQELNAIAWTINGLPVTMRSMFKFSGIPSGGGQEPPIAAYLTLYSSPTPGNGNLVTPNAGWDNSFYIRRVTDNWIPTSTNWFNQPATTSQGEVFIPHTDSPVLDLVNIDVTQMVQDMYTSGNFGFMIQLQGEYYYNSRIFCSSNYPDASKRPRLTIVF
ncbi:DNRLRE domain-containing protein [Chitinophaga filiformis]|uniref:DNRLRE domain-containing protein n=1 Tax=Chitinophaga filiformis TaxID=104663 RepID=UPI001F2089B2|nr:DNRLRE domain-containing protein [Chitinophaga filiformis]MCF6403098.1 DNRLRE domain-containing protein [Chitinophaga filiformis]